MLTTDRSNLARKASIGLALTALLAAAGCATTTAPTTRAPATTTTAAAPKPPPEPVLRLQPATFAELPGWVESDPAPALQALRRTCASFSRRPDDAKLSRVALYGGVVGEWRAVCAAAEVPNIDARWLFETYFTPHEVVARSDQMRKLTGYYEPVVEARRAPDAVYSEPFLAKPSDLVDVDLGAFDSEIDLSNEIAEDVIEALSAKLPDAQEPEVRQALADRLAQRFRRPIRGRLTEQNRIEPYPKRAGLDFNRGVLAYGRPCDVYDVQVQGSARVRFEDGQEMRMAYSSQNGWRWQSVYPQLRQQGYVASPSKSAVCSWMATQTPETNRGALALDPSYVFFQLEPIPDPAAGPRGAHGVPLTPLGSMAVDPAAHPYGSVLYVDGTGPDQNGQLGPFRRLLVAQDTGGAIRRGPLRGDVFFGTGARAGELATQMNAPARFWTLIPKPFAAPTPVAANEGSATVETSQAQTGAQPAPKG